MKLSNKGRYGVRALFDIAFHNEGRATQIKEVAERQGIPARFLEQIFQDLKRAGLVSAKRGPRGGYQLAKPTSEIRLGDVVRALEGPIALGASNEEGSVGDATSRQVTEEAFETISRRIEQAFDDITVEALCERGEALGHGRRAPGRYVYVI